MQAWITQVMAEYGYVGVALLIALENLFPPIPSEVILTFGGFMTTYAELSVLGVALAATVGSVAGAGILYAVGRLVPAKTLRGAAARWGKVFGFKSEDVAKAGASFRKWGWTAVFAGRLMPIVRSLISIPAGMARMPFVRFLLLTTAGSLIWNIVLVTLGAALGAGWAQIETYVSDYSYLLVGAAGVLGLLLGIRLLRKRQ